MSVSSTRHTVDGSKLPVTSVLQQSHHHAVVDHEVDADEKVLVALGYKQEFKRDFSIWSCFAVSFSVLGILPSIASTLSFNLAYSGPAGSVWGWIVAGVLSQTIALAMAELCSSMPTAGGLYYAAAVLAPDGWGPLAAWITGWSNFLGQLTGASSVGYALAFQILTAGAIANPSYVIQDSHIYLVFLGLLGVTGVITMQSTKIIAHINVVGTWLNLIALLLFVLWMPLGSINHPKVNPDRIVWTSDGVTNGTEWPTGFAFMMGFLSVIWTLSGYDAPFHLCEEVSNANLAAPRAIVMTSTLGLVLGFPVILAIAYTVTNVGDVVAGSLGQPIGALCLQVLGPRGALGMFAMIIVTQFIVLLGCATTVSRVIYAYSRDGALPGSRWWSQVNRHTRTPVNAVWINLGVNALLGLLMFAGPTAIGAVFSAGAIAQYAAFTIPIFLRLTAAREKFRPGPWHLGKYSKPVGIVACAWVSLIIPILCFPAYRIGGRLNAQTMNWTIVIYGGAMTLALAWYAVDARKWFKGPKVNVEHIIHGTTAEDKASENHVVVVGEKNM